MKLSKTNLERLVKAVSGQQWQVQGRGVRPTDEGELPVAYIGKTLDEVIAEVQLDFADDIVTMNNLLPDAVIDLKLAEKWRQTALEIMALCVVVETGADGKQFAKCNVCGMGNAHMPNCKLLPQVNNILWLDREEKKHNAGPTIEVVQ